MQLIWSLFFMGKNDKKLNHGFLSFLQAILNVQYFSKEKWTTLEVLL